MSLAPPLYWLRQNPIALETRYSADKSYGKVEVSVPPQNNKKSTMPMQYIAWLGSLCVFFM
jgi:hypothetical protein